MKRKTLLILLLICVAALLCACNQKESEKRDLYALSVELEGDELSLFEQINYTARADLSYLSMRLYANAFGEENDVTRILSVKIDGQTADFDIVGDDRTVMRVQRELQKGARYLISVFAELTLPKGELRLSVGEDFANLALFYPVVSAYDGGWREDEFASFGDPYFSETADFFVSASFDDDYAVASSGRITSESVEDGVKSVEIEAENIRDFAMTLAPFRTLSDGVKLKDKEVKVKYCFLSDDSPAVTLERIISAIEVFSAAFGDYPYSVFTLAQGKLGEGGGMEYGSFALVPAQPNFLYAVTHEVAHQWWYGAVGNDQISCAWLDEGLCEFCSCYYYLLVGDKPSYDAAIADLDAFYDGFAALKGFNEVMDRRLGTYLTEGEYVAISYAKGALMFKSLFTVVGERKFQGAMREYYRRNLFGIADEKALADAFKAQGYDVERFLRSWLDGKVIV